MSEILGFSGSPIKGGNLEYGLKTVLEATGAKTEFIRLYDFDLKVCRGCKKCAATNHCILDDSLNQFLDLIVQAKAVIFSGYPSFGSVNAMTKLFIERNWPLRHREILTQGKIGAAVICGHHGLAELADYFQRYFVDYLKTNYKGALIIEGNVPCLSCGFGEDCPGSGFLMDYGPGAKITPDKFRRFQDNPLLVAEAKKLGQEIGKAVKGSVTSAA
ncbi:MAG: flavodoxin family protein [Deltaproteobacteria bacterium]|jgi:multimeric flavodoxin WrbA|nr:flavodoxin family protein [Deltaproteobacteria bacterium]